MDLERRRLETIASTIRSEIVDSGTIGFDRFMELALYGPGGYYQRPPIGPDGDFVTSPHVHPVFGGLLAEGVRELWEHLGRPEPLRLVEIGAGDGTLARQLLEHLGKVPLALSVVERSEGARASLAEIPGLEVVEEPARDPHVVLGHELLDNLPFRLVAGATEIRVGLDGTRFVRVPVPVDVELAAKAGPSTGQEERAVPTGALALIDDLARNLGHGYALFLDYGGPGGGGPVHGYRDHRLVRDVLAEPGASDITAGVDLDLVATAAAARGLQAFPVVSQRRALANLGFADWMGGQLRVQGELLNRGEGVEAVRRWAGRSSASILVDPGQLGRIRWLGLSSPGLPRPSFLRPDDEA
jgi:SAM-dependent MidA family methyltransferase